MICFFDRNFGTSVPMLLKNPRLRFPHDIEYHQERFSMDASDDEWLAQVGLWGWTVFGHDSKFHLRDNELEAIKQHEIGCFYLWGATAGRWEKLRCLARAYDRIVQASINTPRPFIYRVAKNGALRSVNIP